MEFIVQKYLYLSAVLFCLGLYTVLTRRNAVAILMGIELILNSAGLNFVAFSRYIDPRYSGEMFTIFIIVLAAAEVAVALGIVIGIYRRFRTVEVDEADILRR